MSRNKLPLAVAGVVGFVALLLAFSSLFVVHQTEQALVVRLGEPRQMIQEPGLKVKAPFIEEVVRYDNRLLELDPPAEQVILADQKRIEVDTYTRFRIEDPLKFYRAVRTEENARARLREIISSSLRRVLGNVMLPSVLSEERARIMSDIQEQVTTEAKPLGIAIADVRLRRADLPEETSQSIYARMKSEREREAREARAQGQERAQEIRSRAERERTVILAEAQRQAQILRGTGDAEASRIFAAAYNQDPAFFAFFRTLQAYRTALSDDKTALLLSPEGDFFRYFENMSGQPAKSPTPPPVPR